MINKITRDTVGEFAFNLFIDNVYDESFSEHRRGSNFYTKWIFEIDPERFPEYPDLHGFWESNSFVHDTEYGHDKSEIYELTRVEKRKKVVETEEWVAV